MKHRIRALALAGALIAAASGATTAMAEELPEDRIQRLERLLDEQARQVDEVRRELNATREAAAAPAALPSPATIEVPATSTAAPPRLARTSLAALRWGGYATLEYRGSTRKNSFFDLHRLVLSVDGEVTDCVDVSGEFEFEHGGIGGGGVDGEIKVEHFTVTWHVSETFGLKIGAPLVPFGRYNLVHDDPVNDFTLRPWVARYMVPTGFGQPGVGVFGSCPVGCGVISYDVLLTNGFDDGFTNSSGVRGSRASWRHDNNESKQLWGRVAYAQSGGLFDYLEAGVSGTWARYDDADDNDLFGFAADLLLRKGPLELQSEYYVYDIERDALDPATAPRGMSAWYVQLAYHFFPTALCACKGCLVQDTSHFTLALRYQSMDLDDRIDGASFNDDLEGFGVALNYRLNEGTVVRVDHQWLEPENGSGEREWSFSFSTDF
ncbi:MAG: porin [Planctomycetota bacterium]|nr:porin [Planctomycetota bacterium]